MTDDATILDEAMARAIVESHAAMGSSSPNPPVGAVIVDGKGAVIAVGHTQETGGAHAEVMALRAAGEAARGATAVVTLEPCNHTGRTGPCTQALIDAGVARGQEGGVAQRLGRVRRQAPRQRQGALLGQVDLVVGGFLGLPGDDVQAVVHEKSSADGVAGADSKPSAKKGVTPRVPSKWRFCALRSRRVSPSVQA